VFDDYVCSLFLNWFEVFSDDVWMELVYILLLFVVIGSVSVL